MAFAEVLLQLAESYVADSQNHLSVRRSSHTLSTLAILVRSELIKHDPNSSELDNDEFFLFKFTEYLLEHCKQNMPREGTRPTSSSASGGSKLSVDMYSLLLKLAMRLHKSYRDQALEVIRHLGVVSKNVLSQALSLREVFFDSNEPDQGRTPHSERAVGLFAAQCTWLNWILVDPEEPDLELLSELLRAGAFPNSETFVRTERYFATPAEIACRFAREDKLWRLLDVLCLDGSASFLSCFARFMHYNLVRFHTEDTVVEELRMLGYFVQRARVPLVHWECFPRHRIKPVGFVAAMISYCNEVLKISSNARLASLYLDLGGPVMMNLKHGCFVASMRYACFEYLISEAGAVSSWLLRPLYRGLSEGAGYTHRFRCALDLVWAAYGNPSSALNRTRDLEFQDDTPDYRHLPMHTLCELCRVAIRNELCLLHSGAGVGLCVRTLPLPQRLKDYLMLNDHIMLLPMLLEEHPSVFDFR